MPDTEVLIVGAGPTGLVLALWLQRLGVAFRIIDKTAEPGTTSRALVVHARTLEFYRQLGIVDDITAAGLPFGAVTLWVRGEKAAHAELGAMGTGISPYPYMLILPQDEHERVLIARLAAAGVHVERRTELLSVQESGDAVRFRLLHPDGSEEDGTAAYLAGCDGARSTVRAGLDAGFPGSTYARLFYVADVEAEGPVMDQELHIALDDADFLAVFPLRSPGHARLVGTVLPEAEARGEPPRWEDVSPRAITRLGMRVRCVNWFSTYHVHHRVASAFRQGRCFLLGDAGHIHSPVGGQGMNTGIGDASNLGWKLAAVLQGRAAPALLDTYGPERIAFARRLVASTDRAFTFVTHDGPMARWVRVHVVPSLLPPLLRLSWVRRAMFRRVSQVLVNYRGGALSTGQTGTVRGGDRLPWVPGASGAGRGHNFAPLQALDWQVHVYGPVRSELAGLCARRAVALHVFPWQGACRAAGLRRGGAYLVRPDGYVGWAGYNGRPAGLEAYLDRWAVRPRAQEPGASFRIL